MTVILYIKISVLLSTKFQDKKNMRVGGGVRWSLSIFHWKFKNCFWSIFVLVINQCRMRLTYFSWSIIKKISTYSHSPAHKELKRENFSFTCCVCVCVYTPTLTLSVTHMCMHTHIQKWFHLTLQKINSSITDTWICILNYFLLHVNCTEENDPSKHCHCNLPDLQWHSSCPPECCFVKTDNITACASYRIQLSINCVIVYVLGI